jgi:hypothetical protein
MVTTTDAVTRTIYKIMEYIITILSQNKTHLKQTTAVVEVMVNLRMVTP